MGALNFPTIFDIGPKYPGFIFSWGTTFFSLNQNNHLILKMKLIKREFTAKWTFQLEVF